MAQVREQIRQFAGQLPDAVLSLRAEAIVSPSKTGELRVVLTTRLGELIGERIWNAHACEDLARAVALHLAFLLRSQPDHHEAQTAESTPALPSSTPNSSTLSQDAAAVSSRPAQPEPAPVRAQRRMHFVVQLPLGMLGVGALSSPGIGFGLAAGVRIHELFLLVDAQAWLEQSLRSAAGLATEARIDRRGAGLRACYGVARWGRLDLAPCLRVAIERIGARGAGSHVIARSAQATWVAPGVGLQVQITLTHWFSLVAHVAGQVELSRPRLTIDDAGEVGQLGPISGNLSLGAAWIL